MGELTCRIMFVNQTTQLGTVKMMSVLLLTSLRVVLVLLLTPTLVVSTPRRSALDRKVSRLAPERKPWMLSKHLLDRWSFRTNVQLPVPLFDASKLHGLDASAINVRTENDRYIDVFLDYRWYCPHKSREPTGSSNLGTRSSPTF